MSARALRWLPPSRGLPPSGGKFGPDAVWLITVARQRIALRDAGA